MSPTTQAKTAAALIIGNELLTGKVQDANVAVLARELFDLGISFQRVVICTDDVETIREDLDLLRRRYDHVFTSGGVGPTHDDVTMEAIARAFGRRLVRSPVLEELLKDHFQERCTQRHLLMARVPEGAELVVGRDGRWPTVRVDNVFILPGLPEIFRRKLPTLREELGGGAPFLSKAVATRCDEGELASVLEEIQQACPEVAIGSYPRWGEGEIRVVVTFDGRQPEKVERAASLLRRALPSDQIVEGGLKS